MWIRKQKFPGLPTDGVDVGIGCMLKDWIRRQGPYCMRFRFRSSPGSSSSFSLSAVSVGFRICAMLPRRVGGAELSFTVRRSFRFAEFHDQLLRLSSPLLPLEKGGGGVSGLE